MLLFPMEESKGEDSLNTKKQGENESIISGFTVTEKDIEKRLQKKPYYEAVKMIKALPKKECPFEKLFLLNEVRRSIEKNIQKFWAGIQIPRDKLELGADQFISIFIFVILKAQIDDF